MMLWSGQETYHYIPIKIFKALCFTFVFLMTLSGVYKINRGWGRGCKTGGGGGGTTRAKPGTDPACLKICKKYAPVNILSKGEILERSEFIFSSYCFILQPTHKQTNKQTNKVSQISR